MDRFLNKIKKTSGCWLWTGSIKQNGYGAFRYKNKTIYAHRFSWELHTGKIPNKKWVLHKCDNPPCVNPSHLFLGDHKTNCKDMCLKGRNRGYFIFNPPIGDKNCNSKITKEIAFDIKKRIINHLDVIYFVLSHNNFI